MKKSVTVILALCICLWLSACAGTEQPPPVESGDPVVNTAWRSADDGSYMVFSEDAQWAWYQSEDVTDDNYFSGTYQFYMGQPALDYITEDLKDYGITVQEMESIFADNDEYDLSNFVCMTALHQSFVMNGLEQLEEETPVSYYGFLLEDGTYLDIANMNTGTYYAFEKQE